jgi:hypothetical protein
LQESGRHEEGYGGGPINVREMTRAHQQHACASLSSQAIDPI